MVQDSPRQPPSWVILAVKGCGARRAQAYRRPAPKSRTGEISGWVFFILSIAYLIIQFNPATMQWNMDL